MKKLFALLCPLLLVLVMVLSACTDKPEKESQTVNPLPVVGTGESQQPGGTDSASTDPSQTDGTASANPTLTEPVPTSTEEEETIPEEIVVTIGEDEQVVGN